MIRFIPIALAAPLAAPLPGPATPAPAGGRPPNILVLVADDLGYADVSFNPRHAKEVATPRLDALAQAGVVCRQGYVPGNVCSPTRAGLLTGRYPQRCGIYTGGEGGSGLPLSESILPQFLKPAGYVSAAFGKWHLGLTPPYHPVSRGFDAFYGFLGRGAHDYFKLDDPDSPLYRGLEPIRDKGYLTDRLGEEAAAFIARHAKQPFFVYLAFNAVHAPLQAPADEIAKFDTGNMDRNTILAMGKRLDDAVGHVVETLKREGVWENTLTFFLGDNGGALSRSSDNTPLRGGKHQDFEGGIRVPFLVCWPDRLKGGVDFIPPVTALDIVPTALSAAGVSPPPGRPFDGIDLLPLLRGEAEPAPRRLFWASASAGWWAVRDGDWKLVCDGRHLGLYDLAHDVQEEKNLAGDQPDQVAALRALHDAWLAGLADPIKGGPRRMEPPAAATPPSTAVQSDRDRRRQERREERRAERKLESTSPTSDKGRR